MNLKRTYTEAFREQALQKVYTRGDRGVNAVADELNVSHWTLKGWMKSHKPKVRKSPVNNKRPNERSRAECLQLLLDSHGLDDEALNAFCRENGIFAHQLQQWREGFETSQSQGTSAHSEQLRELKHLNKSLERELNRKEKALAEAAALLVLQKKYQALWEDKAE